MTTTPLTSTDLQSFAHVLLETGFDLLTEYGTLSPAWCSDPGTLAAVLQDYDFALRRLGVTDSGTRKGFVDGLRAKLQEGTEAVPLSFKLTPNTWGRILHGYADDLAERWPIAA